MADVYLAGLAAIAPGDLIEGAKDLMRLVILTPTVFLRVEGLRKLLEREAWLSMRMKT